MFLVYNIKINMNDILIKINNQIKIIKDFFRINPHKHWNFLLYVFLILVLVLILFSFYLLYKIKQEDIFQVTVGQKKNTILLNEKLLKNINEIYNQKASKILDIKRDMPTYSDPSF